jgi:hypothetical protein
MNTFLDLIAAALALSFRIITAPLLVLLFCISGTMIFFKFLNRHRLQISFHHLRLNKIAFPLHLKRHLLFRH